MFYSESEIAENGQTLSEIDETGENKTKLNYIDGTNIVSSQVLSNGSKFAYGRDVDDTITAITQSTLEGEENSTQTQYTFGVVTELKSGNNIVNYEYDHKRRITKVGLNGNASYLTNSYVTDYDTKTTNAKGEPNGRDESGMCKSHEAMLVFLQMAVNNLTLKYKYSILVLYSTSIIARR